MTFLFLSAARTRSCALAAVLVAAPAVPAADLAFRAQQIEADFGVGYAVELADVNRDGKLDIFAINPTQAVWFENPTWKKHVVMDGLTEKDNVSLALNDVDGDGRIDAALGAAWRPRDTKTGGTMQWLRQPEDPTQPWKLSPIGSEPTMHRMRWADVDGDGVRELIAVPLHGRDTSGPNHWEGAGARILVLRPPDWRQEVADDSLHILHNLWVDDVTGDGRDDLITASHEGLHVLSRDGQGHWTKANLDAAAQGDANLGAGEVQRGVHRKGTYYAAIEPWHANHLVVYDGFSDDQGGSSAGKRTVLTDQLGGGHAVWTADLDGDEEDELLVGWRLEGKGPFAKPGVAVFDYAENGWSQQIIDSGGMATEDLTAGDLNADGALDIVAVGRSTHNVVIYWQRP